MKAVFPVLVLAACAPATIEYSANRATPTAYEMSGDVVGADVSELAVEGAPPVASVEISNEESDAFRIEAARLQSHSDNKCRVLGAAMQNQLSNVQIFDKAIVRHVGQYTFYGAGYSYQKNGQWTLGVARKFDELNPRTIADETRTLRHEVAHTLGASERRNGDEWSARDYADRCA